MQPMAFQRDKYSAELYKYTRETTGSTSTLKYYFAKNISITVGFDKAGRAIVRASEPIPLGSLLSNIKDSNGNLILDDVKWQVNSLDTILSAFGSIIGYRMKIIKYTGTI